MSTFPTPLYTCPTPLFSYDRSIVFADDADFVPDFVPFDVGLGHTVIIVGVATDFKCILVREHAVGLAVLHPALELTLVSFWEAQLRHLVVCSLESDV